MALDVGTSRTNGDLTPSSANMREEEDFYDQILAIRDAVIAGTHPQIKLPQTAIEQLKAGLAALDSTKAADDDQQHPLPNSTINSAAFSANQQQSNKSFFLPGLGSASGHVHSDPKLTATANGGLNPIFLEKADSLVRAESQLKRQRIERELDEQVHQRRHAARERDAAGGVEAHSQLNVDAILERAQELVMPISGLSNSKDDVASSIDTDSYYSSKAGDTWTESSDGSASDKAAGAFTADFEGFADPNVHNPSIAKPSSKRAPKRPSLQQAPSQHTPQYLDAHEYDHTDEMGDDEDEEYSPPDASAFDNRAQHIGYDGQHDLSLEEDGDDDEYEPGEITLEGPTPPSYAPTAQPSQPSPNVPIIRNHLTHIAAPQPSRVSPLATAKGPNIEVEMQLVNGRPELVPKGTGQQPGLPSSGSPSGNNRTAAAEKAARRKERREFRKRKRDTDRPNLETSRKRRNHQSGAHSPPTVRDEPYIKPEPVSPPPFATPKTPPFEQGRVQAAPAQASLASPYTMQPTYYIQEHGAPPPPPPPGYRYEQAPPPPVYVRAASPKPVRPVQRDNHDLRRVASLHYAQRPPSPPTQAAPRAYSPPVYRAMSAVHQHAPEPQPLVYAPTPPQSYGSRPPRPDEPRFRPPPSPPQVQERQIVVDAHGNRFYAEPVPPDPRASVAPPSYHQPTVEIQYDYRAPSRAVNVQAVSARPDYAHEYTAPKGHYEEGPYVEMVDDQGRRFRAYREAEDALQHLPEPPSHAYHLDDRYAMPPPALPASTRQTAGPDTNYHHNSRGNVAPPPSYAQPPPPPPAGSTSPVYMPPSRAYSVRPDELTDLRNAPRQASVAPVQYLPLQQDPPRYQQSSNIMAPPPPPAAYSHRQASVAPVQYARHHIEQQQPPPQAVRAVSVMPTGHEYPQFRSASRAAAHPAVPQWPSEPPQEAVRYVDAYGNEVSHHQIRPAAGNYRY
ncbi:hypothetical protein K431DRAFT_28801 [Polychaeton citri CBS 116435]|uniref:Uncharacterized protein n=1 Tax=Polychaeton citri CBS 116435 TaxID=1314669 RepID=A0A9P4QER2_9PEZI|nr:hypothetical protein K431DRAFT_28801 [Polychaeton citri CBS 116435]